MIHRMMTLTLTTLTLTTLTLTLTLIAGVTLQTSSFAAEPAMASPAVGAAAIDFDLPIVGATDETIRLSDEYAKGPVVVVVLRGYPGYQCPLCSRQVGAMVNRAKTIAANASRVIFIYPGAASSLDEHAEEFMGQRTLPSPLVLVRDPDMKMVDAWGLRWNAPRETAYPATYVIDGDGKIVWKLVSDSHAGRSTAEDVIQALKKI